MIIPTFDKYLTFPIDPRKEYITKHIRLLPYIYGREYFPGDLISLSSITDNLDQLPSFSSLFNAAVQIKSLPVVEALFIQFLHRYQYDILHNVIIVGKNKDVAQAFVNSLAALYCCIPKVLEQGYYENSDNGKKVYFLNNYHKLEFITNDEDRPSLIKLSAPQEDLEETFDTGNAINKLTIYHVKNNKDIPAILRARSHVILLKNQTDTYSLYDIPKTPLGIHRLTYKLYKQDLELIYGKNSNPRFFH